MLKTLLNIKNKFQETNEVTKKDWLIYGLVAIFLFTCFVYWDMFATTLHTTNFIEVISQGKFLDFYKINYQFDVNGIISTACYEIPIYFIFMIWDLPLWVLQHFLNINIINNFFCILWMKGILIVFLILCSIVIKKICENIGINKKYLKWVILIFISSPLIFSPIFILSQYDIIPMFFVLLGILAYIKEDNRHFLLWFAIAIPMKLFALFIFIPLVLLKQKSVMKIIRDCIGAMSLYIVFKFIALFMPMYIKSTKNFTSIMIDKLLGSVKFNINFNGASLFATLYVLICVFCYIKNLKNKDEFNKYAIYIPFIVYTVLFLSIPHYPYWIIYLTPFFSILLFKNSKYFKVNLLLDMIFGFVTLLIHTIYYPLCFGGEQVNGMLLSEIFGKQNLAKMTYPYLKNIYDIFKLNKFEYAFLGIYLAISISLIVINFPRKDSYLDNIKIERSLVWLRMLIIVPFALLMVFCYFS